LGAGTIIRQGNIVRGLTTAASLWTVSGIGLAAGVGFYEAAVIATVLVLIVLVGFKLVETKIIGTKGFNLFRIRTLDRPEQMGKISAVFGDLRMNIKNIQVEQEDRNIVKITVLAESPKKVNPPEVIRKLAEIDGIKETEWE
jgi:putative Mg2+ transporter-C (MgtC) family protein